MRPIWFLILFSVAIVGCHQPKAYRALPQPTSIETPSVNPDVSIRQKNWRGPKGEGSCVHASLSSMLHWQNKFELARWWRDQYGDGEWIDQLRRRLDAAQVPYAFTEKANIRILDDAHRSRRGALLWWKPNHCCTFVGWVRDRNGKEYAAILDNNATGSYEFIERSQFHKAWAGYGGVALTTLYDPPSAPLWKSYESVEDNWKW
jgi:hypothetical protein